jgi:hypothetical protein
LEHSRNRKRFQHFETDNKIFIIAHGVVYPLKKKHYSSTEEALDEAEEIEKVISL